LAAARVVALAGGRVASFDAVASAIIERGGREAMPKFAVPGVCWQGYFLDTEDNVFGIFEPDPSAA
jgi:predicted enzyme related to lactoylglutathione lyase